jgi:hypothetical protein
MKTAFKLSIILVSLLHLVKPLLPFDPTWALFAPTLVALVTGIPILGGTFRNASVVFLAAGSAVLLWSGASPHEWAASFNSMTNIIAIIVVMQLFGLPLALGGYQESILRWVRRTFKRQLSLYLFTSALTHVLASFLSFGSVTVAITLLEKTLKKSVDRFDRFTATAVSRGYSLMALWAPGAINVFLVLEATGVAWSDLLAPGLILSAAGILLSYALERFTGGDAPITADDAGASDSKAASDAGSSSSAAGTRRPAPAGHILAVTGAFVAGAFVMEKVSYGATYNRIILAGCLVSLGWLSFLLIGGKTYGVSDLRSVLSDHWKSSILKSGDLAPFFIAMGAFSGSLESSGLMEAISPVLSAAAVSAGPAILVAVPVVLVALGIVGVHPFITIVLFGKILTSAAFPVEPITIAFLLAVGGVVSYTVSPFTGIIMTIAKLVDATAFDVAVRWNWLYCVLFAVLGIAFSFAWGGLVAAF